MRRNNNERASYGRMNRRRMLEMSGLAAALGLAGCMGDGGDGTNPDETTTEGEDTTDGGTTGDGTETTTGGLEDVGGTFRTTLFENPNEFYWFFHNLESQGFADTFDVHTTETIGQLTYEHAVWGEWVHNAYVGSGDARPRTTEVVETSDNRIEFTLIDEFNWSNGDPVTSRDAVAPIIGERLSPHSMSFEQVEQQGPSAPREAVTDFELPDDKTAVLHSDGGYFGEFMDQRLWYDLLVDKGPKYPTTGVEPYEAYVDQLFDTWDQYVNGEVDPWSNDQYFRAGIQNEVYGGMEGAEQYIEKFSNADNVVTNGAWQIDEVLQNEIVFTPNEHHRNADQINFDEIRAEWMQETNTIYTSLNAGRLDFAPANPPPHLIDEFPDTYEQINLLTREGSSVLLNHNWPGLHKPKARQALQHALDTPAICENVNPEMWEPIQVPAGDAPYLDQYLDQSWVEENLIDYSYDPETATQKMEEAGFSKPNDTWLDENGDPIELVFHTQSGAPTMENIVAQQLSDFGVQAEVRPLEETQFENAKRPNNLCMWPESYGAGYPRFVAQTYNRGWQYSTDAYATRWFNKSELDQLTFEDYVVQQQTPEEVEHMTTHAPPVGQPDGGLQEYKTMWMTRQIPNLQGDQLVEYMKKLFWLVNWHVPSWPIANTSTLRFLNTENWIWPKDADHWEYLENGSLKYMDMHSWGDQIFADPDNPKPQ